MPQNENRKCLNASMPQLSQCRSVFASMPQLSPLSLFNSSFASSCTCHLVRQQLPSPSCVPPVASEQSSSGREGSALRDACKRYIMSLRNLNHLTYFIGADGTS